MENKLSKDEFVSRIKKLNKVTSQQGVIYSDIEVCGNTIYGIRQSTKKDFQINLQKLYNAYIEIEPHNLTTTALGKYVKMVQSPSLAILKAIE